MASHAVLTLPELPACPLARTKSRVLPGCWEGDPVRAPGRDPGRFFSVYASHLSGSFGSRRGANRSLPAGGRPRECLWSFHHMKWAKVPSKTGLSAWTPSRERPRAGVRSRRLPQPAGPKAAANGWQRGGLCCQLAGGAAAFCHNLVPSTCGDLAVAGPSGKQRKVERQGGGEEAGKRLRGPSFRSRLL